MKRLEIADLFCGAGGTSTGAMEAAEQLGLAPRLTAVNHWPVAVATHERNHPDARHLCTSIDDINPRGLYKRGELSLLWASPECTHHSVARGGRPINEQSRATAWCVPRWADALLPPVILVENVPEFAGWGPVDAKDRPIKNRRGEIFRSWLGNLQALGYRVDWRVLCAADYGDPTTRRRLFVQAVRGRRRVCWPNPTHADPQKLARDTSLKPWVASREIIDWSLACPLVSQRARPLAPKTMTRIIEGYFKFGGAPFIVPQHTASPPGSVEMPIGALTTTSRGVGLAQPYIVAGSGRSIDEPLPPVTAGGVHAALVKPFLVQVNHGNGKDAKGDSRRSRSIDAPLPAVCGHRGEWALCAALLPQQSDGRLRSVDEPAPTVAAAGAIALVKPFLVEYYGTGGAQSVDDPLNTVTSKHRHALVLPTFEIDGKTFSLDFGFRMLQPHELAGAQGFHDDYIFTGNKTEQVAQIGNAVPRRLARAIVAAALTQKPDVSWLADE